MANLLQTQAVLFFHHEQPNLACDQENVIAAVLRYRYWLLNPREQRPDGGGAGFRRTACDADQPANGASVRLGLQHPGLRGRAERGRYIGLRFTPDGALGATFWIPAFVVPLLLVSHVSLFGRLINEVRPHRIVNS